MVGNLGRGAAHGPKQRGLARVGQADQSHIRQQLQLQLKRALLPCLSSARLHRRLVGGALEVLVAESARSAPGCDEPLAAVADVGDNLSAARVGNHRSQRDGNFQVRAIATMHRAAHAVAAVLGPIVRMMGQVQQRIDVRIADDDDIPALATIPAVGAAFGNVLLASQAHGAVATLAGTDEDRGAIEEEHAENRTSGTWETRGTRTMISEGRHWSSGPNDMVAARMPRRLQSAFQCAAAFAASSSRCSFCASWARSSYGGCRGCPPTGMSHRTLRANTSRLPLSRSSTA